MSDLVALVDLDGTLADYDGALQQELAKIASPGEAEFRSFMGDLRPDWLEARRQLISSLPGFWRDLPTLPAGFDVVDGLRLHGFRIHILTKGPRSKFQAWAEKLEWCRKHVPESDVSITEDKSLSYGRILVDDWPPYFHGWLAHRPRGVVIVPAQAWNVECEAHAPGNIFRYDRTEDESLVRLHQLIQAVARRADGESFDVRDVIG